MDWTRGDERDGAGCKGQNHNLWNIFCIENENKNLKYIFDPNL